MHPLAEFARRFGPLASLAAALGLTGCGIGTLSTQTDATFAVTGAVHGGMQPVVGAAVQLFATGNSGNGSASTPLLATPAVTDSHGAFALSGSFTCPTPTTQVYLSARGGNPGLPGAATNPALSLVAALGSCGSLGGSLSAQMNEVTTAAAAYALAQFGAAYDHIGATPTNTVGITNAFLDAGLLANPATGAATQLPANLTIETGKLYGLADALASCVNSDGGLACQPLFTAATPGGGSAPADTFTAALNIARSPGSNVSGVYAAIGSTPPFATSLSTPPSDWTMSLRVTGGGIAEPTGLGLDSQGNVWVTNYGGDSTSTAGLIGYSPQGTPFAGSPFSPGLQTDAYSLTVDKNDNVWVPSYDNVQSPGVGSLAKFMGASSGSPGTLVQQYTDASLYYPQAIAADPAGTGTVLAANYSAGTVSIFHLDGSLSTALGANLANSQKAPFPVAVVSDGAGGAWTADQGANEVTHFSASGTASQIACCNSPNSISLDPIGNVWVTSYDGVGNPPSFIVTEVAPDGTVQIPQATGGGAYSPAAGVVDAGGQFWVLDYNLQPGASYTAFTEFAGNSAGVAAGTPLSPASGFGLGAKMTQAYAVAVDASGNLWMTVHNDADSSLRMFFGIATPTAMPATPRPQVP